MNKKKLLRLGITTTSILIPTLFLGVDSVGAWCSYNNGTQHGNVFRFTSVNPSGSDLGGTRTYTLGSNPALPYHNGLEVQLTEADIGKTITYSYYGCSSGSWSKTIADFVPPIITVSSNPGLDDMKNRKVFSATTNKGTLEKAIVPDDQACSTGAFSAGDNYIATSDTENGSKVCFKATLNSGLESGPLVTYEEIDIRNIDTSGPNIQVTLNIDEKAVYANADDPSGIDYIKYYVVGPTEEVDLNDQTVVPYDNGQKKDLREEHNGKRFAFVGYDRSGNASVAYSDVISGVDSTNPTINISETDSPRTMKADFNDPSGIKSGAYYFKDNPNNKIPYNSGDMITLTGDMNGKVIVFEATDNKGNVATQESNPITNVDTTPPVISVDVNEANQTITPNVEDEFGNPDTYFYYTEGDENNKKPYIPGQPIPLTEDMNGKKVIFEAKDFSGNTTVYNNGPTITGVDTTPPSIVLNYDDTKQTITPTVTDDNLDNNSLVYYVEGDEGNKKPYIPGQIIPLTEDMNGKTIIFEAKDTKNNSAKKDTRDLFNGGNIDGIDNTKPTLSLELNKPNQTIKPTVNDQNLDLPTLLYYIEGTNDKKPYTNGQTIPLTEEMSNKNLIFEASDTKGNKVVSQEMIPSIDRTAPNLTLTKNDSKQTIVPTIKDDNLDPSTLVYYFKDEPNNKLPYTNNQTIPLTEKMNGKVLVFEGKDLFGNKVSKESPVLTNIDNTKPEIDLTKNTTNQTITPTVKDDNLEPTSLKWYIEGDDENKVDYTNGVAIPLTEAMNGKKLVFEATDTKGNKTIVKTEDVTGIDRTGPKFDTNISENKLTVTFDKDTKDTLGNTETKYYFKDESPIVRKDYKEPFAITSDMDGKTLVLEITDGKGNKTIKEIKLSYRQPGAAPSIPTIKSDSRVTTGGGSSSSGGSSGSSNTTTSTPSTTVTTPTKVETKEEVKETPTKKSLLDSINKEAGRTYFEFNGGVYSIKDTSCNYGFVLNKNINNYFNDVDKNLLGDIITNFKNAGIISGVGNNNFEPLRGITRAEFLSIILKGNCLNEIEATKEIPFNDVKRDHWHYNVIKQAYNLNIIAGYGDGTVRPQQEISRIEALAVLMRVNDLRVDIMPDNFLGHRFMDIKEEWQNDLLDKAIYFGMINDKITQEFKPNKVILRQEVIKFMNDLFTKYLGK